MAAKLFKKLSSQADTKMGTVDKISRLNSFKLGEDTSDLVLLPSVEEDEVVDRLGERFQKDKIYTFIGPVSNYNYSYNNNY